MAVGMSVCWSVCEKKIKISNFKWMIVENTQETIINKFVRLSTLHELNSIKTLPRLAVDPDLTIPFTLPTIPRAYASAFVVLVETKLT